MYAHIPDQVTIAIYPPPQPGLPYLLLFSMPKENINEVQVYPTKSAAETGFKSLTKMIRAKAISMGIVAPKEILPPS